MRQRLPRRAFVVSVLALLVAAPSMLGASLVSAARAAPLVPARPAATETGKVILGETSPDAPALWTLAGPSSSSAYNAVLAWTGTDALHHVNFLTSVDGTHWGNKVTLAGEALGSPAVAVLLTDPNAARILVVAWTGTDANHSLHVLFDALNVTGHRAQYDYTDNSLHGPALVVNRGLASETLELAWTGTDANHSLNVRALNEVRQPATTGNITGLTLGTKRILPAGDSSNHGPGLAATIFQDQSIVLLTWAQKGSRLALANVDAPATEFVSHQTTVATPSLLTFVDVENNTPVQRFYWSWTGTDAGHSLSILGTTSFTNWSGPVTSFPESALGGPALGYVGVASQLLLTWTGVDPAHHLNVATIQV